MRKFPQPLRPFSEFAGADDFPSQALRERHSGVSVAEFRVALDGKVVPESCSAAGDILFDMLTCKLVTRRMLFEPGTAKNGQPIVAPVRWRVTWQMTPAYIRLLDAQAAREMASKTVTFKRILSGEDGDGALCGVQKVVRQGETLEIYSNFNRYFSPKSEWIGQMAPETAPNQPIFRYVAKKDDTFDWFVPHDSCHMIVVRIEGKLFLYQSEFATLP